MEGIARAGLAARGLVYVLVGLLAVQVATGGSRQEADQRGALRTVAGHAGGMALLVLLCVGFASYALWRLSEVVWGVAGKGDGVPARLASGAQALAYGSLAVTTGRLVAGSGGGSQDAQQEGLTAKALAHPGGQVLVALVGVVVAAVGLGMVWQGVTRKFEETLRLAGTSPATRSVVLKLGLVGTVAKGLVLALAGGLVVEAAVRSQPGKARGLDGALRTLAAQPYGEVLLLVAALGLVSFGAYGFAEARWHVT